MSENLNQTNIDALLIDNHTRLTLDNTKFVNQKSDIETSDDDLKTIEEVSTASVSAHNYLIERAHTLLKEMESFRNDEKRFQKNQDNSLSHIQKLTTTHRKKSGKVFLYKPTSAISFTLEQMKSLLIEISHTADVPEQNKLYIKYEEIKKELTKYKLKPELVAYSEDASKGLAKVEGYLIYKGDYEYINELLKLLQDLLSNYKVIIEDLHKYYKNDVLSDEDIIKPNIIYPLKKLASIKSKYRKTEREQLLELEANDVLPEYIKADLIKKFKELSLELSPLLFEYYADQFVACITPREAVNMHKDGIYAAAQEKLYKVTNLQSALSVIETLPVGMEKLYGLHWIAENEYKYICRDKKRRECFKFKDDKLTSGKDDPTIGKAVSAFLSANTNIQEDKLLSFLNLKDAISFRNKVAHQGIFYAPQKFQIYTEGYRQGIKETLNFFKLRLDSFPIMLIPLISDEEREKTLNDYLFKQGEFKDEEHKWVNGFENDKSTQLSAEKIKATRKLDRLFTSDELAILSKNRNDHQARKNFWKVLIDSLDQHYSELFDLPGMRWEAKKPKLKAWIEKEQGRPLPKDILPPGWTRALFIAGTCESQQDKKLDMPLLSGHHKLNVTARIFANVLKEATLENINNEQ